MPDESELTGETTGATTGSTYPSFTPSSSIHITKFTKQNYYLWRAQILPYLRGQGVYGYIDGSVKPPPITLAGNSGGVKPNPDYADWSKNDNLILSTIISSLSDDVLMQVYTCSTSAAIWLALQTSFASQSWAKLVQLRSELTSVRKGELSASDYYFRIKRIADELALAGHGIADDDLVAYILVGLGSEFDSLVTMVTSRESVTLDDLYSLLLTTESCILQHRPVVLNSAPPPVY